MRIAEDNWQYIWWFIGVGTGQVSRLAGRLFDSPHCPIWSPGMGMHYFGLRFIEWDGLAGRLKLVSDHIHLLHNHLVSGGSKVLHTYLESCRLACFHRNQIFHECRIEILVCM